MFIKKVVTFSISLSLLLIASSANAEITKQTLNISDAVLLKRMFIEKSITMPQLKLFNNKGALLYETNKKDDKLTNNVLSAIQKQETQEDNQFDAHLFGFLDAQGSKITLKSIDSSKLIFVESYVDWFDASKSQRQDLEQVLAQLEDKDILWLELDVDPKKMKNMSMTITEID
jgi:homoserine acetyltransferase